MDKERLFEVTGFKFILNNLELKTGFGRKKLQTLSLIKKSNSIARELEELTKFIEHFNAGNNLEQLRKGLSSVRDISGTIARVRRGELLDDIDLFELKNFLLTYEEIRKSVFFPEFLFIPSAEELITLLDPEGLRLKNFHIYSAYSKELAAVRQEKRELVSVPETHRSDRLLEELKKLKLRERELEGRIRKELSRKLHKNAQKIVEIAELIAKVDFLQAKVELVQRFELTRPTLSREAISFQGLFNPEVREILRSSGREFQPVDLKLEKGICIITGANMCGKTVLLRTIALAQLMFQHGFYIPARKAELVPFDGIFFFSGDYQSYKKGLSSFAAEVLEIKKATGHMDEQWLILFDELARNTNPDEGKALVIAIAEAFAKSDCYTVVTTHYDGVVRSGMRHYRIKGLKEKLPETIETPMALVDHVDYSLVELNERHERVPHEALKIAKMFGLDEKIIERAEWILSKEEDNSEK
ncbi:hypothetical protein IX53_04785 [Kosmotoga pacifica]|uniref:DNA mismatch repair proteins mutS family domain-containing protein n=1 Tax=Kosmotoga pacifica TaxID=1330330 RepID=A0A0G2ZAX0_9BACT|nr:hypothetical protein IX53_04785 [Kosmotoga pacifica]